MPIYEYSCGSCGTTFERIRKFSDPPVTECPGCQTPEVKKLVSAPAFHLKGGGWYKDHYGLKESSGDSGSSTSDSASATTSTAGSSSSDSSAASSSDSGGDTTSTSTSTSTESSSSSAKE